MTDNLTITTERLDLRTPMMEDWPAYLTLMRSDRARFMGGPYAEEGAWQMFCHDVAQWRLLGHGALTIVDRTSGDDLGQVAINGGPLFPEKELGWLVYPEAEGRGIAFEAASALRDWAFKNLELETLVSYVDADNQRSCDLALRLGAQIDDAADRPHPSDLVFRHK